MRFPTVSAVVAGAALLPFMAQADGLNYSYADVAYVSTDIDNFDEEVDGFALRGSIEVSEQAFLFGDYIDQSTTVFGEDLDVQTYDIGLGYAWSLSDTADFYGKVGYVQTEIDFLGFNIDDNGYLLAGGLRGRVAQQFELEGAINYTDLSDSGDSTSLGIGARWYFTEQFTAGVEGEFGDDANTYGIGLRWNFGG